MGRLPARVDGGESLKKIVLFTQRVEVIESYQERRDCADQRIAEYICDCGYIPIPVPNNSKLAVNIAQNIGASGIVLTGGNSLVKYGGNAPERDETDKALIEYSIENGIPLYGFCRGMQSILDYFGNNLVNVGGHVAVRHKVNGENEELEVNSYHNQACLELKSDCLEAVLLAEDGVIEKVRHKEYPIVGTMWHPERENPFRETDKKCLKSLIEDVT